MLFTFVIRHTEILRSYAHYYCDKLKFFKNQKKITRGKGKGRAHLLIQYGYSSENNSSIINKIAKITCVLVMEPIKNGSVEESVSHL